MTLLTVTECLDSGEKVYRAKTTLTARTTIKTEAAHWILESSIWGSKNCTLFFFFFFCIYHNAVVKCLLCVYHSVALEEYRDVLSLPELTLARETESCYVYWYRSVVISLPPPSPIDLAISRDVFWSSHLKTVLLAASTTGQGCRPASCSCQDSPPNSHPARNASSTTTEKPWFGINSLKCEILKHRALVAFISVSPVSSQEPWTFQLAYMFDCYMNEWVNDWQNWGVRLRDH